MLFQRQHAILVMTYYSRLIQIAKIIAYFTVKVANEAGVDLVLIQPFWLYYAKLVVVMLTSIF